MIAAAPLVTTFGQPAGMRIVDVWESEEAFHSAHRYFNLEAAVAAA